MTEIGGMKLMKVQSQLKRYNIKKNLRQSTEFA